MINLSHLAVLTFVFLGSTTILTGCATTVVPGPKVPILESKLSRTLPLDSADNIHYIRAVRAATDRLASEIPEKYSENVPIIVATLVDINHLSSKPQFGRVMSEQISSRLVQRGFSVIELKLKESISIRQGLGEILLSRELKEISEKHQTSMVVLGSYTESIDSTVVNLRAVRTADGISLASSDFSVINDIEVRNLLATASGVSKEILEAAKPIRSRQFKVEP